MTHADKIAAVDVVQRAKKLLRSNDPGVRQAIARANAGILAIKDANYGNVHSDQVLSTISVQYRNQDFIGTQLMPVISTKSPSGKYYTYNKRDRLAAPDDAVGIRTAPNEIADTARTLANYTTDPYALKDFVAERTLQAQDAPLDEMVDLVASVNDAIDLREEKRIAAILTSPSAFVGNTLALGGTAQWSDPGSDPVGAITGARDGLWSGPGGATKLVGYCGLAVYNMIRRHAKIVADFKHVAGLKLVTRQQLAEYLELDDLIVGRAWEDTANDGQAASYSRIWGKVFGIIRIAQSPGIRTAGFGYTFRFGQKVTTQWYDPAPGVEGGYHCKVGVEEGHMVVAPDAGFLFTGAIA